MQYIGHFSSSSQARMFSMSAMKLNIGKFLSAIESENFGPNDRSQLISAGMTVLVKLVIHFGFGIVWKFSLSRLVVGFFIFLTFSRFICLLFG